MPNISKENGEYLARYWKSHIDKWSDSGLTQTEYCRQNKISRDRFTYWKTKFKKNNFPVDFVQVSEVSQVMRTADLKLNIGGGLQIEIPENFSQVTLEQVLKILEGLR